MRRPGAAAGTAGDGTFALLGVAGRRRRAHARRRCSSRGRRAGAVGGLRDRRPPRRSTDPRRQHGPSGGPVVGRDRGDDLAGARRVAGDPVRPRLGPAAGAVRDRDALAPPLHGVLRDVRRGTPGRSPREAPLPRGVGGRDRRLAGADPRRPSPPRLVQGRALQRALLHGRRRHALDRRPADPARPPDGPTPTTGPTDAGGPFGQFAQIECFDYPFYNTLDVDFYASFARLQALARAGAGGHPRVRRLGRCRRPRDRRDPVERPAGARGSAPARCPTTSAGRSTTRSCAVNAYRYQDINIWKDLGCKYVLQLVARARRPGPTRRCSATPGRGSSGRSSTLAAFDRDGDGLPEHDGDPTRPTTRGR